MIRSRSLKGLLALTLLGLGGHVWACGGPIPIRLPSAVGTTVVRGHNFYAVTAGGRLIAVDLRLHEVKDVAAVAGKDKACLDVADGKACIASSGRIDLIDLNGGKLLRSVEWPGEVLGVGFVTGERVFVRGPNSVAVVDLESGRTLHALDIGARSKVRGEACRHAHCLAGATLYVANPADDTIAVVDLEKGKLVDAIKTPGLSVGGICVAEDKVFVLGLRYSYGVWTDSLGWFDRTKKKYAALKLPGGLLRGGTLAGGPDGTLFVVCPEGAIHYDAAGTLLGKVGDKEGSRFAGVWGRHALLTAKDWLRPERLPRRAAEAN